MGIEKEILKRITQRLTESGSHKSANQYQDYYDSQTGTCHQHNLPPKKAVGGAVFLTLAVLAIIFFIIFGIYELAVSSPLGDWISKTWNGIMQASPQKAVDMVKQVPSQEVLMQKNVGDWLGSAPTLFKQVLVVILSPLNAIFGLLIVVLALGIRMGDKFMGHLSLRGKSIAKILSWLVLGLSFVPLMFEYII